MKDILKAMIFFRKKKPEPAPEPAKKPAPSAAPAPKPVKSLQEIAHTRVLTAEGWRRSVEKKLPKKSK
jgi:hypothetical protein